MANDPDTLLKFWRDPLHHHPIGAEPLTEFAARVSAVWHTLVKEYIQAQKDYLDLLNNIIEKIRNPS